MWTFLLRKKGSKPWLYLQATEFLTLKVGKPRPASVVRGGITLTFSNGEQRLFDATILTGPAFKPLADEAVFKNCKIVDGVVTWMDEEIDCAPEYMYTHSYEYPALQHVG